MTRTGRNIGAWRVVTGLVIAGALTWCGCRSYPWSPESMTGSRQGPSSGLANQASRNAAPDRVSSPKQPKKNPQQDAEYAAQLAKARTLERAGKLDAAREIYERLIVWAPDRYEAYHRLAVVCDRQQRFLEAESLYAQAIRLNPKDPDLFNDLGYCYLLQGKLDKAERALLKAVGISPANERYRNNLGLVYGYQGRYQEALDQFRRGGSEADAWYNLAYVQWVRTEVDAARQSLEKALAINPGHELARETLVRLSTGQSFFPDNAIASRSWQPYQNAPETIAGSDVQTPSDDVKQAAFQASSGTLRLGLRDRPSTQTQLDVARSSWAQRVREQSHVLSPPDGESLY
ncbi:MAG: tetratricopeptide repeat protein [Thermogutta sp.]|jgi:Flp pilus assembly protein TadD